MKDHGSLVAYSLVYVAKGGAWSAAQGISQRQWQQLMQNYALQGPVDRGYSHFRRPWKSHSGRLKLGERNCAAEKGWMAGEKRTRSWERSRKGEWWVGGWPPPLYMVLLGGGNPWSGQLWEVVQTILGYRG